MNLENNFLYKIWKGICAQKKSKNIPKTESSSFIWNHLVDMQALSPRISSNSHPINLHIELTKKRDIKEKFLVPKNQLKL